MSELKNVVYHDELEDKITVAHYQDVTDIVDQNKKAANEKDKHAKWNDWERVASIPSVVVMEWLREGINVMAPTEDDKRKIRMKLNSPEYAYLRTRGGRL
jgi:hypothetical protein